jgi:hypothetical protein
MTDLQINIALAEAMGWGQNWDLMRSWDLMRDTYGKTVNCFDESLKAWRKFDYRDPVIFVAICKHWKLNVRHKDGICFLYPLSSPRVETIEKSAALVVIELAKRGDK